MPLLALWLRSRRNNIWTIISVGTVMKLVSSLVGLLHCLSLTRTVPSTTLCAIIWSSRLCLLHWALFDYLALILWLLPPPVSSSPKPLHLSLNECWLPLFFLSRAVILPSLTLALPTTCFLTSRPSYHTSLCAIFKSAWEITCSFQFLAAVWQ